MKLNSFITCGQCNIQGEEIVHVFQLVCNEVCGVYKTIKKKS